MKRLVRPALWILIVGSMSTVAPIAAAGSPHDKQGKHRHDADNIRGSAVAVRVWFPPRDVAVIREYYTPRYRNLPPGLQKKLRRTGRLPPGWQKKLEPFPVAVERQLVVLPRSYRRGVIDGHAVIVNPHTGAIIDLAVLF